MPGAHETPEVIIQTKLASSGISETTREVEQHATAWDKLAQAGGRVEQTLGRVARGLGALAGAAGVGALVNDFVRLETQANRTALAVGRVTGGRGGFDGTRRALQTAAIATGQNPLALGAGIENTAGFIGAGGLGGPRAQQSFAQLLGGYGGAYSIDPSQLGSIVGALLQSQGGQPASQAGPLLSQLAGQAARGGMEGQFGAYLRTVQGIASSYTTQQPTQAGPGLAAAIAEQYTAAANANPAYRNNPQAFGSAQQAVTGGLQGAYGNPRLQALLQMGGIGYWDQRAGVQGHPDVAAKVKRLYDSMYGGGYHNIAEDLALRSAFGIQGADYIETGGVPDAARLHHGGYGRVAPTTQQRLRQYLQGPQARINIGRQRAERGIFDTFGGAFGDILNFTSENPWAPFAAYAGLRIGGRAVRWGSRRMRGARTQAEAEAGDARGATLAEEGATSDISAATREAGGMGALGRLGGALGGVARRLPVIGTALGAIVGAAGHPRDPVRGAIHGADPFNVLNLVGVKSPLSQDGPLGRYSGNAGWGHLWDDTLGHVFGGGDKHVGLGLSGSPYNAAFAQALAAGQPAPHTLGAYQQARAQVKLPGDPTSEFSRAVHEFHQAVRSMHGGSSVSSSTGGAVDGTSLMLSRALGRVAKGIGSALGGGGSGGGGNVNTAGLSGQQATIARAAGAAGIPASILWGLYGVETSYGRNVTTSSTGATGPFQFEPGTAREYHINPNNFTQAAYAAARFLKKYWGRGIGGALSAYNAGPHGGFQAGYVHDVLEDAKTFPHGHGGGPGRAGPTPVHVHVHTHVNGTETARMSRLVRGH